MIRMPGKSFAGALPPLSEAQTALRAELMRDVQALAGEIGERNVANHGQLTSAAEFLERSFAEAGYQPRRDSYDVEGRPCHNLEAELPGRGSGIIVVGAHYDSVAGSPGANDNGSGVAAVLALARRFAGKPGERTLRFVTFVNEEPGHFQTELMGSWVYASRCRQRRDQVAGMICLETIGCFSAQPGSQTYPVPMLDLIYPSTGNFIAFVGDLHSRRLVRNAIGSFRRTVQFPSEGAVLPASVPGVGWSDHWSFWQHGYPALMVTDTAPFRYPHYHLRSDMPDKLDYDAMARVVTGIQGVIDDLVSPK
jgi:Zn-dependent M28 family amino/carboxypeptidase